MLAASPGSVVVGVGGMGLKVEVPSSSANRLSTAASSREPVLLHTHLIVREDSLTLFGFESQDDRGAFETLMGVSGIGPRLALAAIDMLGADGLRRAVASSDLTALQRIPGVGKKTAQRMALEIGDKLGSVTVTAESQGPLPGNQAMRDSVEAGLEQLGWPRAVAQRAVESLEGEYADVESMLRAALANVGTARG